MTGQSLLDDALIARLGTLALFTRNTNTRSYAGGYQGLKRGGEVEFADYKPYSFGDDLRYIDWNVYGRLGTFVTKQFGVEEQTRVTVLLDTSSSMQVGGTFSYARRLAAAIAAVSLLNDDIVSLIMLGTEGKTLGPVYGKPAVYQACRFLEECQAEGALDAPAAINNWLANAAVPERVLLITDSWLQGPAHTYLGLLSSARMETTVLQLAAPEELNPRIEGRFRFTDIEDGAEITMMVGSREQKAYRRIMEARLEETAAVCHRLNMDFVLLDTSIALEETIFGILRDRGVLQ